MEQTTINLLTNYMPMVRRYKSQFLSLNTLLGKTTLTGKISSLDIAENLFEYMETTQTKFGELQEKLIHTIMEQSFLNRFEESFTSVKIASDLLSKYFKDRCDDVLTLSKNRYILERSISYNSNKGKNQEQATKELDLLKEYLGEFRESYGYYKDILFYDLDGNLIETLNNKALPRTKMQAVLGASNIEDYMDFYERIDFYEEGEDVNHEFFFVVPIKATKESNIQAVAVFIVDFKSYFDEISATFPFRLPQSELVILDAKNKILFTQDSKHLSVGQVLNPSVHKDYTFIEIYSKVCMLTESSLSDVYGYKGIAGDWRICRIVPLVVAFDIKRKIENDIDADLLTDSLLITEALDNVIAEVENINEDLADVVINGEIIASKSHSYALNPILNNIRILSEEMNNLCIESTAELQKGIYDALFSVIGYYSKYSIYVANALFDEGFKDVAWIKNATEFRNLFSEYAKNNEISEATMENARKLLKILGDIFTAYSNIILFDNTGKILLNAQDDYAISNKTIHAMEGVMKLKVGELFTSHYEPTFLNDNQSAFVFYTALHVNGRVAGGLGFVFNIKRMQDMLVRTLPKESHILSKESDIFSVVFDSAGNIYATTKSDFTFEAFNVEEHIDFKNLKPFKKIVKINNKYYLLCSEVAPNGKGTISDYTKNPMYCLIFVAVKEDFESETL